MVVPGQPHPPSQKLDGERPLCACRNSGPSGYRSARRLTTSRADGGRTITRRRPVFLDVLWSPRMTALAPKATWRASIEQSSPGEDTVPDIVPSAHRLGGGVTSHI